MAQTIIQDIISREGDQPSLIVFQDGTHLIDRPSLFHRQYPHTTVIIAANQRMRTHRIFNANELKFRSWLPVQRNV